MSVERQFHNGIDGHVGFSRSPGRGKCWETLLKSIARIFFNAGEIIMPSSKNESSLWPQDGQHPG